MEGIDQHVNAVLHVNDLRLRRGARTILDGVSFTVARGEIVAVLGLSGSGKTTILRAVAELEPEGKACVQIAGGGNDLSTRRRGSRLGMVFQFHCLFEHLSVLDNVCLAPVRVHGVTRHDAEARAIQWLDDLGIGHRKYAFPRELSGGEAQRAAIARALAMDPPLLLLDEPTASLDPPRRTALGELIRGLARADRGVLVTSHDLEFVREFADRILVLAHGAIVEEGIPAEILANPAHDATRALLRMQGHSHAVT
jgi:ABC-type polar amino acid transport system ATPase subunit